MADNSQGSWSSIPGTLTGVAAVITAITALYLATRKSFETLPHQLQFTQNIGVNTK